MGPFSFALYMDNNQAIAVGRMAVVSTRKTNDSLLESFQHGNSIASKHNARQAGSYRNGMGGYWSIGFISSFFLCDCQINTWLISLAKYRHGTVKTFTLLLT
jgi:hypothetical protein